MNKSTSGRFFEDYEVNEEIIHAVPRTITYGDISLYTAITGSRFALHSSDEFAKELGYPRAPVDDILVFHMVFGRTVPDLSLNAIANLGYAGCRFGTSVFPGDTVKAKSTIIGVKENSNKKTGTVYVKSIGYNQKNEIVIEYYRWLMMRKRDQKSPAPKEVVPNQLPEQVPTKELHVPKTIDLNKWDSKASGSDYTWKDFEIGEKIHHLDGQTIEEAEHQLATRLYQNNARVHFNQHIEKDGRFKRRIIYGGYIISLARAISCNGLANAFKIVSINAGRHTAPTFAGDTVYAWAEILEKKEIPNRKDVGGLRIRTLVSKNNSDAIFPKDNFPENIVLDLDYTVLVPTKLK